MRLELSHLSTHLLVLHFSRISSRVRLRELVRALVDRLLQFLDARHELTKHLAVSFPGALCLRLCRSNRCTMIGTFFLRARGICLCLCERSIQLVAIVAQARNPCLRICERGAELRNLQGAVSLLCLALFLTCACLSFDSRHLRAQRIELCGEFLCFSIVA